MLEVCLLGCGGMLPLPDRFLTSLLLRENGSSILIDCGEGTQVALHLCGWSVKRIDHILITHFHGDHVVGLPGLFMTMGNNGRTEPVHIWGNPGLRQILDGLLVVCPQLPFEVHCHDVAELGYQFQLGNLQVQALPVEHRVSCLAYSLSLPRAGKFDVAKAQQLQIPVQYWAPLQHGEIITYEGCTYYPQDVLGVSRRGLKLTYATDCRPSGELVRLAQGSDLFVAEGLYGDEEKQSGAAEKGHMIFSEAATMAQQGHVRELWLTHYSPAMREPTEYLAQTQKIFSNTKCGENLLMKTLRFDDSQPRETL